jgi:hypothetical protein
VTLKFVWVGDPCAGALGAGTESPPTDPAADAEADGAGGPLSPKLPLLPQATRDEASTIVTAAARTAGTRRRQWRSPVRWIPLRTKSIDLHHLAKIWLHRFALHHIRRPEGNGRYTEIGYRHSRRPNASLRLRRTAFLSPRTRPLA